MTIQSMPDDDKEIDESDFKEASLEDLTLEELRIIAQEKGIEKYYQLSKKELIKKLEELEK